MVRNLASVRVDVEGPEGGGVDLVVVVDAEDDGVGAFDVAVGGVDLEDDPGEVEVLFDELDVVGRQLGEDGRVVVDVEEADVEAGGGLVQAVADGEREQVVVLGLVVELAVVGHVDLADLLADGEHVVFVAVGDDVPSKGTIGLVKV